MDGEKLDEKGLSSAAEQTRSLTFDALTMEEHRDVCEGAILAYLKATAPAHEPDGMPGVEAVARLLCKLESVNPDLPRSHSEVGLVWTEWSDPALEVIALFSEAFAAKERERAKSEAEVEHFAKLAFDDLGKNPPTPWRDRAEAAEAEIERMKEMRKRLDRRIHSQRMNNRVNWEIVETRRKWLGSMAARTYWRAQKALADEWKARAIAAEALLVRAKDHIVANADDLSMNSPATLLVEEILAAIRSQGR